MANFGTDGSVIQYDTITTSGTYSITADGAKGGAANGAAGGNGASVSGDIYLSAGTVLELVVGIEGDGNSVSKATVIRHYSAVPAAAAAVSSLKPLQVRPIFCWLLQAAAAGPLVLALGILVRPVQPVAAVVVAQASVAPVASRVRRENMARIMAVAEAVIRVAPGVTSALVRARLMDLIPELRFRVAAALLAPRVGLAAAEVRAAMAVAAVVVMAEVEVAEILLAQAAAAAAAGRI